MLQIISILLTARHAITECTTQKYKQWKHVTNTANILKLVRPADKCTLQGCKKRKRCRSPLHDCKAEGTASLAHSLEDEWTGTVHLQARTCAHTKWKQDVERYTPMDDHSLASLSWHFTVYPHFTCAKLQGPIHACTNMWCNRKEKRAQFHSRAFVPGMHLISQHKWDACKQCLHAWMCWEKHLVQVTNHGNTRTRAVPIKHVKVGGPWWLLSCSVLQSIPNWWLQYSRK